MTRHTVVFDVGGVLVQWKPLELMRAHFGDLASDDAGARAVMAQVFQTFAPEADWGAFDRGHVEPDVLAARIAARTGYPRARVKALIDAIPEHLQPMPESVALLRRVRSHPPEPLPEPRPYVPREYAAANAPEPFAQAKIGELNKTLSDSPEAGRPRQPLEDYPLENFKMLGMLRRGLP